MAGEDLLPFRPDQIPNLIKEGRMRVVTPSVPSASGLRPSREESTTTDPMLERARNLLQKDFLGPEAVLTMQQKLNAVGVNVEFPLDNLPPIPYTEKDIQLAKQNGEMLVLRAGSKQSDGGEEQLTVINFRELFRQDPTGTDDTMFYAFRPGANDWYKSQDFATQPGEISLGWALVKKDVLADSKNKKWSQQEDLLRKYGEKLQRDGGGKTLITRRTAIEAVWDSMLYYTNTGERLLPGVYDWTKSASGAGRVRVGDFGSGGLRVGSWSPELPDLGIGVCSSPQFLFVF